MEREFRINEIDLVAIQIVEELSTNILRIDGEIGSGKTTLIRHICKRFGIKDLVQSPTFTIVHHYNCLSTKVYHFDFFRIEHQQDALMLGLNEYFDSGYLCVLEWAENIEILMPEKYDHYLLDVVDETTRRIKKKNKSSDCMISKD